MYMAYKTDYSVSSRIRGCIKHSHRSRDKRGILKSFFIFNTRRTRDFLPKSPAVEVGRPVDARSTTPLMDDPAPPNIFTIETFMTA